MNGPFKTYNEMAKKCEGCGRHSLVAAYGLKRCEECLIARNDDPVVLDAYGRAVAALLRDVVEEHGPTKLEDEPKRVMLVDVRCGCGWKKTVRHGDAAAAMSDHECGTEGVEEHAVPPTLQSRIQDDMAKYACPPSVDVFSNAQRDQFEKALVERAAEITKARQVEWVAQVQANFDKSFETPTRCTENFGCGCQDCRSVAASALAAKGRCSCGSELLSAESKSRGTCYDCNEAKR